MARTLSLRIYPLIQPFVRDKFARIVTEFTARARGDRESTEPMMPNLTDAPAGVNTFLHTLEREGLIQPDAEVAGTYSFRHTLMQEAAYTSLLRNERRHLHRLTAHALERDRAPDLDQIAALLAFHYDGADEDEIAMQYALRAGNLAAGIFANAEALAHYSHALRLAEQLRYALPDAYHARGVVYQHLGTFDRARADFEAALEVAQQQSNGRAEWQCLMDLGLSWASRDYERAGEYFERALDQAITLDEPSFIAHSLNRLGNWYTNTEMPREALALHQRSLEIFQQLDDEHGLAESYDLLGICMIIAGNTRASAAYYQQAIGLFRKLNDRLGLISSQTAYGFLHRNYDTDLVVTELSYRDSIELMEQALQWAQEIEYHAGESFTAAQLGISYASQGQYARALSLATSSLQLAEQIQHRQWIVSALYAMGTIHAELLDAEYSQTLFEHGVELAQATRSIYWTRVMNAWLAITLVGQSQFARAHEILDSIVGEDMPMQTMAQRRLWSARVLLALGEKQASQALDWTEKLSASVSNRDANQAIPLLGYMQGRALNQLREFDRAERTLQDALAQARVENLRPLLWRLSAALGGAFEGQMRAAEAQSAFDLSRALILELAQEIPPETRDPDSDAVQPLRHLFVTRALARIQLMRAGV